MKIAFNVCKCGLGNNGGSQTIVRMSNALWIRGHEVYIFSDIDNFFTWENLHQSIFKKVPKNPDKWPDVDVIISTGYHTIKDAIKYSERTGARHLSWLRGWERWQAPEETLIEIYSHPNIELIANSEWIVEHVSNNTRKNCHLVYSGIPYSTFKNYNNRKSGKTVIGGLAHFTKSTKGWRTFLQLATSMRVKSLRNFEFAAMGDNQIGDRSIISTYVCQPTFKEKVDFYNKIDIWVSTSVLEGLHIPPMEAGLCGAAIVVPDIVEGGTGDYAIDGYSCYKYPVGNVDMLIKWILHLSMDENMRKKFSENLTGIVKNKIGDVHVNAERLENILNG